MNDPFAGVNLRNPWHYPYLLMLFLTPFVLVVCLVTFLIGGWLLGILWFVFVDEFTPEEVKTAQGRF